MLRLRMSGAMLPLLLYAFMACTWTTVPFPYTQGRHAHAECIFGSLIMKMHNDYMLCVGSAGTSVWIPSNTPRPVTDHSSKAAAKLQPEPTQHNSLDRLQTRKQKSTNHITVCVSGYTEIDPTGMLSLNNGRFSGPTKRVCFDQIVWPDTCCSLHRIRVSLQPTKRI